MVGNAWGFECTLYSDCQGDKERTRGCSEPGSTAHGGFRAAHLQAITAIRVPVELRSWLEDGAHGAELLNGRLQHLALLVDPDLTRLAPTLHGKAERVTCAILQFVSEVCQRLALPKPALTCYSSTPT